MHPATSEQCPGQDREGGQHHGGSDPDPASVEIKGRLRRPGGRLRPAPLQPKRKLGKSNAHHRADQNQEQPALRKPGCAEIPAGGDQNSGRYRLDHATASSIAASISAILKGWPETLFTGRASTRNWSRSRVFNWPLFISGTMIRS